ncbi:hypothetical protein TrVE_jg4067 [Triparma verrucosa]|uniref:Uncharacterized protein n=1 Tax=Triparma verrucosa TaxID=1606542 RepID=A0A9W7BDK4_9STRA|nr:hypothetical protein TrVE_jg4067 [Triparma verrucosa]
MYIGPWQEFALSSRLPQNKPLKDLSSSPSELQAQVDYLKKLLESKDVAPNVPRRQRNVNAGSKTLQNPRRSSRRNKANNQAHGYSRILSNVSSGGMSQNVLAFPPPMSARSHKSDATTLSEYSYTRSLPDVSRSAPGEVLRQQQKFQDAPTPTTNRREVGGYNKNLAARMLKVTRASGNLKNYFGANDSIRNMFNVKNSIGEATKKRRESVEGVEQVKLMREVYLNRKEDENKVVEPAPPVQTTQQAVVSVEKAPEPVKDMSLTEKEFSQVSKYFSTEDFQDVDNKEVSPFENSSAVTPRNVSPLPRNASPLRVGSIGSSPDKDEFRVGSDNNKSPPVTPAAGGSTVDELINWVGGLDLKEI